MKRRITAGTLSFLAGGLLFGCDGTSTELGGAGELDEGDVASESLPAVGGARFGTMCQKEYENGWQTTLDYVWNRCGWFNNELDDTDSKIFYYNLHGTKSLWETSWDQNYLDNVNLFYSSTHGGAWSGSAVYAMWDDGDLAYTSSMRLGDESYGLSIMSTYSCDTLKLDGQLINRWRNTMRGGLRYVTGSHDTLWDGLTTDETGEDYADELQKSNTIRYAWRDGNSDWYVDNDVAVMTTGLNSSDCSSRRSGMKWQNYTSYNRRRDGDAAYYCWTYWDNL
ncbi:MAG: hypothetical protein HY698_15680 [Deltaproteobacteria bacterium]|nr:hypothetical protein [Deltaproteobacteria bacterium]